MTEKAGHGHHFKLVLALLLVAGIMGLVVYANTSGKLAETFKIGRFANVESTEEKESFSISMTTGTSALYGKKFQISASPFSFEGVCSLIKVGGLRIETQDTRCTASTDSFTGSFEYTSFGSIMFTGTANSVTVDSNKYSLDTPVSFEFEAIPTSFSVSGTSADKISMVAPFGAIEKYGADGSLKGVAYLSQSTLDLNSLVANVRLDQGELKIIGTATSVKSDEFSW